MFKDFKFLQSDRAFKTGTYISGLILILALFVDTQVLNNLIVASFSASFFLFFIAIWLGTSKKDHLFGDCKWTIERYRATIVCNIFMFISMLLFILALYLIEVNYNVLHFF